MANAHQTRPVNRQEQVNIHPHADHEHTTQVVDDLNYERRTAVSRLVQLIWLLFGLLEALASGW